LKLITTFAWCSSSAIFESKKGAPKGEGGATGLQPSNPPKPKLKEIYFVDIMISKVLRDFPFSRNQPLKTADDRYVRILKNTLVKLIKYEKTGHCD
jgi:hypothetical protein